MLRCAYAIGLAVPIACTGCNALFGLDEAGLRPDATTTTTSSSGGAGGSQGGGGTAPMGGMGGGGDGGNGGNGGGGANHYCGDPSFSDALVTYGDFERDFWGGNNVQVYSDNAEPPCEGAWYLYLWSGASPPGTIYADAEGNMGTLVDDRCIAWSIAARDPLDNNPTLELRFNLHSLSGWTTNHISAPAGVQVGPTTWTFYEGVCELNFPPDAIDDLPRVYIHLEPNKTVYLDAFEAHPVPCDVATPPCGN